MTVIALVTGEDTVALASDSQWTEDTDLIYYIPKIQEIMKDGVSIGAIATSGDVLEGIKFENEIIEAFSYAPELTPIEDILSPIIKKVIKKSAEKDPIPTTILIVRGKGYSIDIDGLVVARRRWCIGCGSMIAYGAMWNRKGSAKHIATKGCEAAIELLSTCGGKIDVFEMAIESS